MVRPSPSSDRVIQDPAVRGGAPNRGQPTDLVASEHLQVGDLHRGPTVQQDAASRCFRTTESPYRSTPFDSCGFSSWKWASTAAMVRATFCSGVSAVDLTVPPGELGAAGSVEASQSA